MTALVYIFIILAILMGMFCMLIIARDVILEGKERRQNRSNNKKDESPATEEKPTVVCEVDSKKEIVKTEEVASTTVSDDSSVVFSTTTQTLEEKYLELSSEYRTYYDEIVKYAMAIEDSKRYKNDSYEEYKVGKSRLVRLKIKRGIIVCELVIPNLTFKTYVNDNRVAMKQAPATIKVVDDASLTAVKDSIDIAVKAIEEEKVYKKEQAKIRRKQRRDSARNNSKSITE